MRYFLLIFLLFFTSCTRSVDIHTIEQARQELNLSDPDPLNMKNFKFRVITKDTAATVFGAMEIRKEQPVLIGLQSSEYKKLAENMSNIRQRLLLQRKIIEFYKNYYEQKEKEKVEVSSWSNLWGLL